MINANELAIAFKEWFNVWHEDEDYTTWFDDQPREMVESEIEEFLVDNFGEIYNSRPDLSGKIYQELKNKGGQG